MHVASAPADTRIWRLLVTVAVVSALYFLRDAFLPVAVAALLAFVLAPAVTWLDRRVGRALSIVLGVGATFLVVGIFAWIATVQILDLATQLPSYKANLSEKLQTFTQSRNTPLGRVARMVDELRVETENAQESEAPLGPAASRTSASRPIRVEVVEHRSQSLGKLAATAGLLLAPLGYIGVVLILSIFILVKRDDLRDRIIGLIGRGKIYATTEAMRDAASRVYRFLLMSLVVNVTYGVPVGIGLYLIGVPSAPLWAMLAIVLRFIPYLGPLVAMALPIALSLAVFDNWTGPILTITLFVVLELISNNIVEPWLYGSSTGISSFALIVAALAWTWLWGPIGLLLSTPLTVCLLVMGKHVPQLSFLTTLLGEESALGRHEVCYQRLVAGDRVAVNRMLDDDLRNHTLEHVCSTVLLPALALVEDDFQRRALDRDQYDSIVGVVLEEMAQLEAKSLAARTDGAPQAGNGKFAAAGHGIALKILCLPAQSFADEAAAGMLAQVARARGFEAETVSSETTLGEIRLLMTDRPPEWVWICAVNPGGLLRCRTLCAELQHQDPAPRVSVGIWHHQSHVQVALSGLKQSGVESVSTQFGESIMLLEAFRDSIKDEFVAPSIPDDEAARLAALLELRLPADNARDALLDRTTTELTRIFKVPIALVNFVDADSQRFASHCGLDPGLAAAGKTPRNVSVCGHVVAANNAIVVEDLARDRRFAGNPLLREHKLRFYAGVPLRTSSGFSVGSLCILDHRPRTVSERELRLLQMVGENLMGELEERSAKRDDPALYGDPATH